MRSEGKEGVFLVISTCSFEVGNVREGVSMFDILAIGAQGPYLLKMQHDRSHSNPNTP